MSEPESYKDITIDTNRGDGSFASLIFNDDEPKPTTREGRILQSLADQTDNLRTGLLNHDVPVWIGRKRMIADACIGILLIVDAAMRFSAELPDEPGSETPKQKA